MNNTNKINGKVVIFDIDETLIYAKQISYFWKLINEYFKTTYNFKQKDFNCFLDLYPETIRPKIINILLFIKNKKIKKKCNGVVIYTNNNGGIYWIELIKNYFEYKTNTVNFFDKIIYPNKIKDDKNKLKKSCCKLKDKCYCDLLGYSVVNDTDNIFYVDDVYYKCMNKSNVFYVNIESYIYEYEESELIERFLKSIYFKNNLDYDLFVFKKQIEYSLNKRKKNEEKNISLYYKISYCELLLFLKIFFKDNKKFTQLRNRNKKFIKYSKTRKLNAQKQEN